MYDRHTGKPDNLSAVLQIGIKRLNSFISVNKSSKAHNVKQEYTLIEFGISNLPTIFSTDNTNKAGINYKEQ